MENINKSIRKHERAIKILEAYKESDRRFNDHKQRLERNEKTFRPRRARLEQKKNGCKL
jgi:hypothetical protein